MQRANLWGSILSISSAPLAEHPIIKAPLSACNQRKICSTSTSTKASLIWVFSQPKTITEASIHCRLQACEVHGKMMEMSVLIVYCPLKGLFCKKKKIIIVFPPLWWLCSLNVIQEAAAITEKANRKRKSLKRWRANWRVTSAVTVQSWNLT